MGKVASQAVVRSLEAVGHFVYQTHFVSHEGLRGQERIYRRNWDSSRGGALHLWQGQWVRKRLGRGIPARWQVITLVRDPVARNVSSFFQVATSQLGVDVERLRKRDERSTQAAVLQQFLHVFDQHDLPLHWLDQELRAPFGVDVMATPFPHEKGWAIYRSERADVLLIRHEDLRRVFSTAAAEFLGGSPVDLLSANVSSAKSYGDVFDAARRLPLPAEYLDRMYDSPYADHFYTLAERLSMRSRWEQQD